MIHKDLFGQKEEIEKKTFLSYDEIPTETRQRVYGIIYDNVQENYTVLAISYIPGKGIIQNTDDYRKLWHEIRKHKRIPYIYDSEDEQENVYHWIMMSNVVDLLQTIELFIRIKKNETQHETNERLHNTINDINDLFKIDKIGYEIVNEKIQKISLPGFEPLIKENIETNDPENIDSRVKYAISKFSHYNSSVEEKKAAIITLAGVLEYFREDDIKLPKNDDSDLFHIINKFDIRHQNRGQQGDYDKDVWYDWMFYTFLASINVLLKLNDDKFALKITNTA